MLYTLLSFILSLFFVAVGASALTIAISPYARAEAITFLLESTNLIILFGLLFIVIGIISFFYLVQSTKRKYYTLKSQKLEIDVSESVIIKYLKNYFRELYPYNDIPCQVELKKRRAEITADLPFVPVAEQKELLKKIEEDLTSIFRDQIGYRNELKVSISFSPN